MPTQNRKSSSPFAASFKSAIKRGVPCSVAVNNIAKRTGKTPTTIFNSLHKHGLVWRQKINGQWIHWPTTAPKTNASAAKQSQFNMWQQFVDWCLASGFCTPEQLNNCSSQAAFMSYCNKFFSKQSSSKSSSRKRSSAKASARSTRSRKSSARSTKRSTRRSASSTKARKSAPKRSTKRSTTAKSRSRKTTASRARRSNVSSYKFPSPPRRVRRAA